jgi:TRAP-type C4-dicarboxylate transport system permease small subunit
MLSWLARLCAILAGLLLTAITVMTCISIVGREAVGKPITGDFELSGVAAGAAIALFMPLCQVRRGNIIVDFFTARCSAITIKGLDRIGAFVLSACFTMLAWRTAVGGLNAFRSASGTMILGFPEWITYAFMVPAFMLTGLIALAQAAGLMDDEKRALL